MRNKLVNERNNSIKFRRDLMSMTYDIDSINCKNNKNHYGSFKDDLINTKNDSSYMIKNKDYIRKYINNNKIYKTNLYAGPKYNIISLGKKQKFNRINNINKLNKENSVNRNQSKEIKKIRGNFLNNYPIKRKIDKFSSNDRCRHYYNRSSLGLKDLNHDLNHEEETKNYCYENFNNNFKKIQKRKINNFKGKSQRKYNNYNKEESKNYKENNIEARLYKNYFSRNDNNNYFKTFNQSKNINNKSVYGIKDILNLLNAKDINDSLEKIKKLLVYKNFIHQLKKIYLEDNNDKNQNEIKIKDILFFFSSLRNYKKKYEGFCKEIMDENNINDFDNLKLFLKKLINSKKNNNNFIKGINRIFEGFNELQPNKTIYRNLSQRNIKSKSNLLMKNEEDFI